MAKAMWDVKDNDAASALAAKLSNLGEQEIGAVAAEMKKRAEEIAAIDGTLEFNVQLSRYLVEAAEVFASTAEGVATAGKQLSGIVASSAEFVDQSTRGTLL